MTDTNTVTLPRSVVEQALEAIEYAKSKIFGRYNEDTVDDAQVALVMALEQPQVGEVAVTTNQQGHCVAVTRQDDEGKILSVIWEAKQPQQEQEPVAYFYTRSGRVVSTEATDALMQQMIGESGRVALYAHPQPPRQPLTDKVIQELAEEGVFHANIFEIVRRIEEEHGIFKLRAGIGGEA